MLSELRVLVLLPMPCYDAIDEYALLYVDICKNASSLNLLLNV